GDQHVEEDEVGLPVGDAREGFLAVGGDGGFVASTGEVGFEQLDGLRGIIGDEDARRTRRNGGWSGLVRRRRGLHVRLPFNRQMRRHFRNYQRYFRGHCNNVAASFQLAGEKGQGWKFSVIPGVGGGRLERHC